jgi:hypothetical protein
MLMGLLNVHGARDPNGEIRAQWQHTEAIGTPTRTTH